MCAHIMRELLLFRLIKGITSSYYFAYLPIYLVVYSFICIITRRKSDIYFTNVVMRKKVLYIDRCVDIDRWLSSIYKNNFPLIVSIFFFLATKIRKRRINRWLFYLRATKCCVWQPRWWISIFQIQFLIRDIRVSCIFLMLELLSHNCWHIEFHWESMETLDKLQVLNHYEWLRKFH